MSWASPGQNQSYFILCNNQVTLLSVTGDLKQQHFNDTYYRTIFHYSNELIPHFLVNLFLENLKKQNIVLHEQHNSSPVPPYIKHYTPFAENVNKMRITTNYFSLPIFMTVYKNLSSS